MGHLGDHLKRLRDEQREKIRQHVVLKRSKPYRDALKFMSRVMRDFAAALRVGFVATTRNVANLDNSLVLRATDDMLQSVVAVHRLALEGMHAPARRELRYLLEGCVKNLYVDQLHAHAPFESKLAFLYEHVPRSSIEFLAEVKVYPLSTPDAKAFRDEVTDLYAKLSGYVHVSRRQISERLALQTAGRYMGFETDHEQRQFGRLLFRTYDLALVLYLNGVGMAETGDLFVQVFDRRPKWSFHKGKYVRIVSASFDYKVERKSKR